MPTLNLGRVGFVNKGTWLIGTTYKINDIVTYLGGTYAALQANTGQTPILGGTVYWQEWVANDVVHKSGAETIADVKTFTSSPVIPTPSNGDSSTKAASTAFVATAIPYNINAATDKSTPVDADLFGIVDSAAANVLKKLSWLNIKATLKAYFDTLYFPITGASVAGVRQTVQSGSVDTSGFANFISIGTGLAVNIAATTTPLKIHAAGGAISNDRLGTISADTTISGLTANTTNYLYADVATNGTVTLSANTVAHIEQFGGTPAVTNNLLTFNIGQMTGYTGNGATVPQSWRVAFGEAITGASTVTSVVSYALNGIYDSGYTATIPTATGVITKNSNLGVNAEQSAYIIECTTATQGYSIGDQLIIPAGGGNNESNRPSVGTSKNTVFLSSYLGMTIFPKGGGTLAAMTASSWKYKLTARRGW
jgi:hypothetical protein